MTLDPLTIYYTAYSLNPIPPTLDESRNVTIRKKQGLNKRNEFCSKIQDSTSLPIHPLDFVDESKALRDMPSNSPPKWFSCPLTYKFWGMYRRIITWDTLFRVVSLFLFYCKALWCLFPMHNHIFFSLCPGWIFCGLDALVLSAGLATLWDPWE